MAYGTVSDAMATMWLSTFLSSARYASAHFGPIEWTDPSATEVNDAGYSRQMMSWTADTSRSLTNATAVTFGSLTSMDLVGIGFWTEATGGEMVGFAQPDPAYIENMIHVEGTQLVTVPANQITIRLA